MSRVVLKPGKEKSLLQRHPWIFSGAIASRSPHESGEMLPVYTSSGQHLGTAYFHRDNSIAGRMVTFSSENPFDAIDNALRCAIELRNLLAPFQARRVVNAEGDQLPGLIIDQYNDTVVIQIHTAGMERLKPFIVERVVHHLTPKTVYEKSSGPARVHEGLPEAKSLLYGVEQPEVVIEENGVLFRVPVVTGQKTGFFLDQREMRKKISELAPGKTVLNCFAYTGGFSSAALKGGATSVTSVEISKEACSLMEQHPRHTIVQADVFDFLKNDPLDYDIVILDPPAFAKKRADIDAATRGYREVNAQVIRKIKPRSLLLTSSCSSFIDADLFQKIVFQAAYDTGKSVRIIGRHLQAVDHPISLFHPEGDYLKSLLLYIE